ncbi:2-hydroxyisoflavanone dehydratase-like [Corylus avellana]|uniref:2-hydroxyisoflavanone dehydratase-like n=1 Tax=Corylus avellana TaxID=13451 RepID=UPI001E23B967|nr:2-hydroxyisoflavanone dehydratase-like [Corylus avellana]
MDSSTNEITHEFPLRFRVYKDGRVERLGRFAVPDPAPTGLDPKTHVQTKDVVVSSESGVSARLFLPKNSHPDHKLPLVVHYHGGAFCLGSPFDRAFHNFLQLLAAEANAFVISVDYRLAPEHPLPTAHQDSWAALQWIVTHSNGQGPDSWLNEYADFGRVFLAGESAGANIAHYVAVQAGATELVGPKIVGLLLLHPGFGGKELNKMYSFIYPTSTGFSDPILYPKMDPNLSRMAGAKVLVCVAEKDSSKDVAVAYSEALAKSGWGGTLSFYETEGEDHCFFLVNPRSDKVGPLIKVMADFINHN